MHINSRKKKLHKKNIKNIFILLRSIKIKKHKRTTTMLHLLLDTCLGSNLIRNT